MQIGGLGLMTMSLFIMSLFVDLGLYTQVLASDILSIQSFKDTKRILLFIIKFTFACELLGVIATFCIIRHDFTFKKAVFLSIFHSVSSFCNVGVSLFSKNKIMYDANIAMVFLTTLLILFGCLGFVTWHEFFQYFKNKTNHKAFSWHTKIVMRVFFISMATTSILFWLLERNHSLVHMSKIQTFFNILLIGVGTKSAGLIPISMNFLQPATILILIVTAFIGSAPSSTGGGVKTSALAIFLAVIKSTIRGRIHVELKGRSIARDQVYKSLAIISIACSWILMITFFLLISEPTHRFLDILLEAVSAFSNHGMTTRITPYLTLTGKMLIGLTMIVGRIGALTLIIGMRRSSDTINYSYPEERVFLG